MKAIRKFNSVLIMTLMIGCLLTGCGGEVQSTSAKKQVLENEEVAALAKMVDQTNGLIGVENDRYADGVAYVYDNSLAAIALANGGAIEEAQMIMDSLLFAVYNDRSREDGRLRNAYPWGDCKKNAGKSIFKNETYTVLPVEMTLFSWDEKADDASTFCRNIAWAIVAFCEVGEYSSAEKKEEYIKCACTLADFMLKFRNEDGVFLHGYHIEQGRTDVDEYRSTTTNILAYSALRKLADNLVTDDPELSEEYIDAANGVTDFVDSMYWKDGGFFYRGILEDNENFRKSGIDLETQLYYLLSFGVDARGNGDILRFLEDDLKTDEGYSFVVEDSNSVYNEGTAMCSLVYKLKGNEEAEKDLLSYLQTQKGENGLLKLANRDGVSSQIYSVDGTQWTFDNIESVSATCWLAFAKMGINPLMD